MRNYIAGTIVATGLIILIFGMNCSGQSVRRLVADIPFDFYVGNEKLPEGRYEFEPASSNAHPGALVVRSLAGSDRQSAIIPTLAADSSAATDNIAVYFNRYGSIYYLSRVNFDQRNQSLRLGRASGERQLARQPLRLVPVVIGPATTAGK